MSPEPNPSRRDVLMRENPVVAQPEEPAAAPSQEERDFVDQHLAPATEPTVARATVPRWVQLGLLPVAVLGLWTLAQLAGRVLLLFMVAGIIALILTPVVTTLQPRRVPRGLAVLTVYLLFFVILTGVAILLANPISSQVKSFTHDLPRLVREGNQQLANTQTYLDKYGVHVHFIKQGKTALQTLQDQVSKAGGSLVSFGGGLLTTVVKTAFDFVIIFVVSVYMLLYGPRIGELVRRVMPSGDGTRADDYPTLVQLAVSSYVRGQLLFSLIMGTTAGLALYLFGVLGVFPDGRPYAIAFGAFVAVMEFIPYLGPILGALPPILVALFTDPITALWVALLFLALQQLEGHVVAPQIFSHSLRVNPLLVIFALLLGQEIDGVIGAILALPSISILRETVVYLSRHLALEPWGRPPDPLL